MLEHYFWMALHCNVVMTAPKNLVDSKKKSCGGHDYSMLNAFLGLPNLFITFPVAREIAHTHTLSFSFPHTHTLTHTHTYTHSHIRTHKHTHTTVWFRVTKYPLSVLCRECVLLCFLIVIFLQNILAIFNYHANIWSNMV